MVEDYAKAVYGSILPFLTDPQQAKCFSQSPLGFKSVCKLLRPSYEPLGLARGFWETPTAKKKDPNAVI